MKACRDRAAGESLQGVCLTGVGEAARVYDLQQSVLPSGGTCPAK
jgi:hypothetical protein